MTTPPRRGRWSSQPARRRARIGALLGDSTARGTVVNDDHVIAPVVTVDDVEVSEGGGAATFTVMLSGASAEAIDVSYTTSDESAGGRRLHRQAVTPIIDVMGFITADLIALSGALPATSVHVFNDAGAQGKTGFTATFIPVSKAISAGRQIGARFNIGMRALAGGASIIFTMRRADGMAAAQVTRALEISATSSGSLSVIAGRETGIRQRETVCSPLR